MQTETAKWYMKFSRHAWIQSTQRRDLRLVEFRDLQFTIDRKILNALGFPERSTPFVLRFTYSADGKVREIAFDGKAVSHKE